MATTESTEDDTPQCRHCTYADPAFETLREGDTLNCGGCGEPFTMGERPEPRKAQPREVKKRAAAKRKTTKRATKKPGAKKAPKRRRKPPERS